ncbi:cadherin repeat domain-containing protein [Eubacterium coprostanoligenes]|uniref:cadherin repeat domain-containing protein n=1 Tax=Eubacterium coprostanoligenes TaxID=290054 RepID=UPI00235649D1|nr:cadherin repeat domain-containing protein [Eubacterium coprostanoligenes]MCI6253184.1 cadherin repeat domain-containing protein [Eubacterium coprostanoligenes]
MEKLLRKTGINQSLRLLLIVASLVFGSSAWGQTTTTIFSETFDKCNGTGGNDDQWSGDIAKATFTSDNTGWTNTNGNGASKCAKYGTSKKLGKATTPQLNFTGDATLTFRAGAWSGDKTTLKLSISNGTLSATTVTMKSGAFSEYTINITDVTAKPTITFEGEAAKSSRFFLDDVVVTQTTPSGGGGKTAATVTFEKEIYSVQTNGKITVSATTNSSSPIVYSISPADGNVSIDENTGKIVAGTTAGTYTITASVAENKNFTSASATCPLTVTAPAPPSYIVAAPTYYKKITSTDELAVGGTYLIVCEGAKKALSATVSTVGYTQGEKNTVTNETAATLGEFELIDTSEDYNGAPLYEFLVDNKYLSSTTSTNISLATSVSDKTKWKVNFDKDGNVEIDSYSTVTASTPRGLLFQNGQTIKHYAISNRGTSNYPALQLYQKVTDLAISTLTNGYATFVTDVPYAMPKGACGYAVTVAPHVGVITKTEAYTEGSQVPAQTALLIGGASGTNYYPAVLKENVAASYTGENYMEGKRTAEGYTDTQKGVAVYYYKLALNNESKPGFYYGVAGGAAFQLTKPTTAYLAVPQSITPVNGYLIDFDGEETGISTIAPTNGNADGAIYNLNGIRMTQTLRNLPKGVYIVNGKKVIK